MVDAHPSLDAAVTLLLQLESADTAGITQLVDALSLVLDDGEAGSSYPEVVCGLVQQAMDLLGDPERCDQDTLVQVSELLEAAAAQAEEAVLYNTSASTTETVEAQVAEPQAQEAPDAARGTTDGATDAALDAMDGARGNQRPPVDQLSEDSDDELLAAFVSETLEGLETAESALLELEGNPQDTESINVVFRVFHTIKGTSAFLGLLATSSLAHLAEDLLSRVRDGELRCAGRVADLALQSVDLLRDCATRASEAGAGATISPPPGLQDLWGALARPIEDDSPAPSASAKEPSSTPAASPAQRSEGGAKESSIRVRTDRLDRLIDMVGELVIAQSMLAQDQVVVSGDEQNLTRKVTHSGKIVRELQDLSMSLRMVPLRGTFQKMSRIVRDAAQRCGKEVRLVTEGDETEIDRNMVDIVNDPLVHMVRNAVDHGLEPPDEREQAGKPREGIVRLSAHHSGGNVFIELQEDGRGLDRDRIAAKAVEKGIIPSDKGMSNQAVYSLIFAPGFSTAEKVTDLSGRGVGLDVVRRNVEELDGHIAVNSEPGNGTTFTLRLPLTLAITDGMLVRVGRENFIIPTITISLSMRPKRTDIITMPGGSEAFRLRGDVLPLYRLHRLFNIPGAIEDPAQGLLVVLHDGERRYGLLVDQLLAQQQVVAKPLGALPRLQGVSGGAILGDGAVGLILDPLGISGLGRQGQVSSAATGDDEMLTYGDADASAVTN